MLSAQHCRAKAAQDAQEPTLSTDHSRSAYLIFAYNRVFFS